MNRPILIQVAAEASLALVSVTFLALGWWIPAVIAVIAGLVVALWKRRVESDLEADEAIAAAKAHDKTNEE